MRPSQEYRLMAAQCMKRAKAAKNPTVRKYEKDVADAWRLMAVMSEAPILAGPKRSPRPLRAH